MASVAGGTLAFRRSEPPPFWSTRGAANYLDSRTLAWARGGGAMERGTFCISCHTGLPFALARPELQVQPSATERQLLTSVEARVRLWPNVQPYLGDTGGGPPTEAVLNALVLAGEDARAGHLSPLTRRALQIMWSLQSTDGSWRWINAGNEPWEAPDSIYWGATLAAVATGMAPDGYRHEAQIQTSLKRLETYLRTSDQGGLMLGRLSLALADAKLPGLIGADQKTRILNNLKAMQHADGGWNVAGFIPSSWKRHDGGPQPTQSDGYATGLAAYTMEQCGDRSPGLSRALTWLSRNQDAATGAWPTLSPNSKKDPASDSGKFMTDAATAYASLALVGAAR